MNQTYAFNDEFVSEIINYRAVLNVLSRHGRLGAKTPKFCGNWELNWRLHFYRAKLYDLSKNQYYY